MPRTGLPAGKARQPRAPVKRREPLVMGNSRRAKIDAPAPVPIPGDILTPALRRLGALIAQGLGYKDIAARLNRNYLGVKSTAVMHLFPRVGVTTQAGFIRWWLLNVELHGDCSKCLLRKVHLDAAVDASREEAAKEP